MGKLASGATFQMKMAFMDEDLKRPKHDDIMFWLTEQVKQPANVRGLIPALPYQRLALYDHRLEAEAEEAVKAKDKPWTSFQSGDRETKEYLRKEPWPNEPEPLLKFGEVTWEVPLKENNRTVAFADLLAEYEYCGSLNRWHTTFYNARYIAGSSPYSGRWEYEESRKAPSYTQTPAKLSIYFEVKTAISSVGELMRQLNFYATTEQFKGSSYRDEQAPLLVVVAPAHAEAESVCRAHGYGFMRYEPDQ